MLRNGRSQAILFAGLGILMGYAAATGGLHLDKFVRAADVDKNRTAGERDSFKPVTEPFPACCQIGGAKAQALAQLATHNTAVAARTEQSGKKPNILIIWGDDIGWFNPSCYHRG
ncbi:MAG: hypothetical protein E6K70_16995, partial [Planctomycetota bacterium]